MMPHPIRRALRRLRGPRISLVYDRGYDRSLSGVPLDPERAGKILAFVMDEGLIRKRDIRRPEPASLRALLRVHTPDYVESLDAVATVTQILGVPVTDEQRQLALELQRLQAGGTIEAARLARRTGRMAVNLAGGLHHAAPDRGMGFCLINDIAIAIAHLRAYGFDGRVLVVDLDLHDGNGTRAAFASDPTVYTLSIHNHDWDLSAGVASNAVALGSGVDDETYLAAVRRYVPEAFAAHQPAFVFYAAGADPAADDRLGDWRITPRGMLARDRFVIDELRRRGSPPMVMVLGGGYGNEAWRYTARFLAWFLAGHVVEPPDDLDVALRRFRASEVALIAHRDTEDGGWGLTADDLLAIAPSATRAPRFLGRFSRHAVELSLDQVGILQRVRDLGFGHPTLEISEASPLGETLRLWGDSDRTALLMELRIDRNRRVVPGMEVLYAEWLLLQNPRAAFSESNPRLPGQSHPGLGLLRDIVAWLVVLCERLQVDGLAFKPAEYYMAVLGRHHMRFLDPVARRRFDALRAVLGHLSLEEASRALEQRRVIDEATGAVVRWEPSVQVYPVSPRLRQLVATRETDAADAFRYRLRSSDDTQQEAGQQVDEKPSDERG